MNFLLHQKLPSLNILIIVIKLSVIMNINSTSTSSLAQNVFSDTQGIHQNLIQQLPHYDALAQALSILPSTNGLANAAPTYFASNSRLRKRHRKRHSIWFDYDAYNENSTVFEWSNPCGGEYNPYARQPKKPTRKEQKKIYNNLRHTALNDFNYLNGSHQQDIDISNIEIWWLHNGTYKFLPKLKMNSSIALKRWYRNMQTYVASFGYLHRIQFKYDRSKSQRESNTSQELKDLLKSSRNMLCELESAVNKTYSVKKRQMPQITRLEMDKRLKLRTKQRFRDNANILAETDSIDLKFVKFYYFEYLKNMWQLLTKTIRRRKQMALQKLDTATPATETTQQTNNSEHFNEVDKYLMKRNRRRKNPKTKHKLA